MRICTGEERRGRIEGGRREEGGRKEGGRREEGKERMHMSYYRCT